MYRKIRRGSEIKKKHILYFFEISDLVERTLLPLSNTEHTSHRFVGGVEYIFSVSRCSAVCFLQLKLNELMRTRCCVWMN